MVSFFLLELVLKVNGEARLTKSFDGRELWDDPKVWTLNPPVPPDATVELELVSKEAVFYLIEEAALSEGPLVTDRLGAP